MDHTAFVPNPELESKVILATLHYETLMNEKPFFKMVGSPKTVPDAAAVVVTDSKGVDAELVHITRLGTAVIRDADGRIKKTHMNELRIFVTVEKCAICHEPMDVFSEDLRETLCDHVFHAECLYKWRSMEIGEHESSHARCPICRSYIGFSSTAVSEHYGLNGPHNPFDKPEIKIFAGLGWVFQEHAKRTMGRELTIFEETREMVDCVRDKDPSMIVLMDILVSSDSMCNTDEDTHALVASCLTPAQISILTDPTLRPWFDELLSINLEVGSLEKRLQKAVTFKKVQMRLLETITSRGRHGKHAVIKTLIRKWVEAQKLVVR